MTKRRRHPSGELGRENPAGKRCSCGQPAVIVCPVCGPECRSCYMAGVEAASFGTLEDLTGLSWPPQQPRGSRPGRPKPKG